MLEFLISLGVPKLTAEAIGWALDAGMILTSYAALLSGIGITLFALRTLFRAQGRAAVIA